MSERLHTAETHCIEEGGRYILLNVAQARVFPLSRLEWEILSTPDGTPLPELRGHLAHKYDEGEVSSTLESLTEREIIVPRPHARARGGTLACPPVTNLLLNVAQDCNLRCAYCLAEEGGFGAKRQNMSVSVARKAVDFLLRESGEAETCTLTFIGGEPMLNFEVIQDVVSYGQQQAARAGKKMKYAISTNGTLFDTDNVSYIKENGIDVQVSLDGPPAVHDRFRVTTAGRASHRDITAALPDLLDGHSDQVSIRATVTRHSPPLLDLLDYLSRLEAGRIVLQYASGNGQEWAIDDPACDRLIGEYAILAGRVLEDVTAGDCSSIGTFGRYLAHFCSGRERRPFCGAGVGLLGVSASGGLYPCTAFAEQEAYRLGDVQAGLDAVELAQWRSNLEVDRKPLCRDCWARYICGGGCLSEAIEQTGSLLRPVETECRIQRRLIELAMWMYLELKEKNPQAFLRLYSIAGWDSSPSAFSPQPSPSSGKWE